MSLPSPPSNNPSDFSRGSNTRDSARYSLASNGSAGSGGSGRGHSPLAHVKDLEERSLEGLNVNQSIIHLVTTAENSLRQAVTLLEYRKPDLAYLEYLRCYEITVNFVCRNPGYPDFKAGRGPVFSRYTYLVKVSNRKQPHTS